MRLFVAIKLDELGITEPEDQPAPSPPMTTRPLATFVAQLMTTCLPFSQTRAPRPSERIEVTDSYSATSLLSLRDRPTLDRSA